MSSYRPFGPSGPRRSQQGCPAFVCPGHQDVCGVHRGDGPVFIHRGTGLPVIRHWWAKNFLNHNVSTTKQT
jgi:hypothetical protein